MVPSNVNAFNVFSNDMASSGHIKTPVAPPHSATLTRNRVSVFIERIGSGVQSACVQLFLNIPINKRAIIITVLLCTCERVLAAHWSVVGDCLCRCVRTESARLFVGPSARVLVYVCVLLLFNVFYQLPNTTSPTSSHLFTRGAL